jgi:hypothetical protein
MPATLVNPRRRVIDWANSISGSVVLYNYSFTGFDPHIIISLTLIDPYEPLSALAALAHLTHLTIAFSTACSYVPQQLRLSEICPPCVEKITLMGVPVVIVDELPDTCLSLSLTLCKEVRLEAGTGSLKELRLDDVSTTKRSMLNAKYLQELLYPNSGW